MFGTQSAFGLSKPSLFGSSSLSTTTSSSTDTDITVSLSSLLLLLSFSSLLLSLLLQVNGAPEDTVQSLKWSPSGSSTLLSASSWDGNCRVWGMNEKGEVEGKAQQNVGAPILSSCWFDVRCTFLIRKVRGAAASRLLGERV